MSELIAELQRLRIRESEIIARLEIETREQLREIQVGDRVEITNIVRKPGNWTGVWDGKAVRRYRLGTVTAIIGSRIYIDTDLGVSTWRVAANLNLIPESR